MCHCPESSTSFSVNEIRSIIRQIFIEHLFLALRIQQRTRQTLNSYNSVCEKCQKRGITRSLQEHLPVDVT